MTYSKYYWLNDKSRKFLSRGYLKEGETGESRIMDMAKYAESILGIQGFAEEFEDYASRGFYSFATPVWVNFGRLKGLGISCYGSYCEDSLDSILNMGRELGMMSKYGGGTSAYLGNIRPRGTAISTGGEADGPTHYAHIYDTIIDKCKQAEARRGACAIYLDIEHPDILEFLKVGTEGNDIQNLQNGVCVGDLFMKKMIAGDQHSRDVWAAVLNSRISVGYPYLFFKDNVNNNTPYKGKSKIVASNLCSEICLPSKIDESFVCCLGSINLKHWDEIKETRAIELYVLFLNAVMEDFIQKASKLPGMGRAVRFAKNHRALGLGVLGYHTYLQENLIEFESLAAKQFNHDVFSTLQQRSYAASEKALRLGFSNAHVATRANTVLNAIAPTKSSSFILGQMSLGIEPILSNCFTKDIAKIQTTYRNPVLLKHLQKHNMDNPEIWKDIANNNGSIQHLDIPNKEVFKSFIEISPAEIILQASQRQKFLDQSQSLNLSIHDSVSIKDINRLYITAWEKGVKTLYYQIGESAAMNFSREINECVACEG